MFSFFVQLTRITIRVYRSRTAMYYARSRKSLCMDSSTLRIVVAHEKAVVQGLHSDPI